MLRMRSVCYLALLTVVLLSSLSSTATAGDDDDEVTAEVNPLHYKCREDGGRYTNSSTNTYLSNLRALRRILLAKANTSIFVYDTVGQAPDAVYGVVLCRGDYGGASCAESLDKAFTNAVDKGFVCPLYKDVTIYYDQHMLRFSGDDFRGNVLNRPAWVAWNMNNVTGADGKSYGEKVQKLTNAVVDGAARSPERYATGELWFGNEVVNTVYALVQCWSEFTADECRSCLADLVALMPEWFSNNSTGDYRVGGRILGVRCNLRYEKELFFKETHDTIKLDMPKNGPDTVRIILISIAAALLFIIIVSGSLWIVKQRRDAQAQNELEEWTKLLAAEIGSMFSLFTLSEIRNATDNFSEAKRLGEGAFGPVYRGQLSCGVVAIKRLAPYSRQGLSEFRNEIRLIANLQHLNLVKLIGCCMQQKEKILVYEHMPNKSLDDVFSDVSRWASLTWTIRRNIITGIAQGLLYIHNYSQPQKCIVHRDLKASNILLDSQMNPKVSDFGIARMFDSSMTEARTTRLMGTRGYMAPEYFFESIFSIKSDVFSFGVIVLEIISGRKVATSFCRYRGSKNLMSYAWRLWKDGNCRQLIDSSLSVEEQNQEEEIIRCIQVALLCVQASPEDRPDMEEVTRMLSNMDTHLENPNQPSYFDEQIATLQQVAAQSNSARTQYQTAVQIHPA